MITQSITKFTALFIILSFTISCSDDKNDTQELDNELEMVLLEASNGVGASYYLLPDSKDFNKIPQDLNNDITPDKVELGKLLFHETAFATENVFPITAGEYSCASCHHAAAGFQSGIAQGIGEGGEGFGTFGEERNRNLLCDASLCDVQPLRSPTVMNAAYQPLMLWSGQFGATDKNIGTETQWTPGTPKEVNSLGFEGVETQAIAGLGVHRLAFTEEAVIEHGYKELWDKVYAEGTASEKYTALNAGLAIAAYERTVLSNEAPFQRYLNGDKEALNEAEKQGAILFFGKAKCVSCHNGPALNDTDFHALGMNEFSADKVIHYDPEDPAQFGRYAFTAKPEDMFKFKTPQLYNLNGLSFFGHGASFSSIEEVVDYKNKAIRQNEKVPVSHLSDQFKPLGLTSEEVANISLFIKNGLYDANLDRYTPQELPSGRCFPNADATSQSDLGCM